MKHPLLLALLILFISLAVVFTFIHAPFIFGGCPRRGGAFDTWETGNKLFKIRITAYEEEGRSFSPARPYYVFECKALGLEDWREIMVIQDESRPTIPHEQVKFVNEQIAYVFMGLKYAITTDSGQTWCVWDAEKTLPKWMLQNSKRIQQVDVASNGTGVMKLEPIPQWKGAWPALYTADYGYHWHVK
jgi:hypothetical protein